MLLDRKDKFIMKIIIYRNILLNCKLLQLVTVIYCLHNNFCFISCMSVCNYFTVNKNFHLLATLLFSLTTNKILLRQIAAGKLNYMFYKVLY